MYRTCIYCAADLGSNEAIESFPVGKTLAFDGAKGRLWAVCGSCARWNLAPIEERWEPVEAAERLFRDARRRMQSENIGVAKLGDGTRLVRIGAALRREVAAWRYGTQLVWRSRRYVRPHVVAGAMSIAAGVGVTTLFFGAVLGSVLMPVGVAGYAGYRAIMGAYDRRVVHVAREGGRRVVLRRWHLRTAMLRGGGEGEGVEMVFPYGLDTRPPADRLGRLVPSVERAVVGGRTARDLLGKAMVLVNEAGAGRRELSRSLDLLEGFGSADEYVEFVAREGLSLGTPLRARLPVHQTRLARPAALALEMALHDEQERRALEGELVLLEAAWREAEEIAAIADRLAAPPGEEER